MNFPSIDGYALSVALSGVFSATKEGEPEISADSLAGLKEKIARRVAAAATVAKRKLALRVIDRDGLETNITGIHAGHGKITTSPRTDSPAVYVLTPFVLGLVERLGVLEREVQAITRKLSRVLIRSQRYSSGASEMDGMLNALERDYQHALEESARLEKLDADALAKVEA